MDNDDVYYARARKFKSENDTFCMSVKELAKLMKEWDDVRLKLRRLAGLDTDVHR